MGIAHAHGTENLIIYSFCFSVLFSFVFLAEEVLQKNWKYRKYQIFGTFFTKIQIPGSIGKIGWL